MVYKKKSIHRIIMDKKQNKICPPKPNSQLSSQNWGGTEKVFAKINHVTTASNNKFVCPSWFKNNYKVDVSIIVPLYKSFNVISNQILYWDFTEDGYSKEIIYVDDACPQKSYKKVLECWNLLKEKEIGNIIVREKNGGYASACNAGAKVANGRYLIFLNADCIVSHDWVCPIMESLSKKDIGIVGNMQVNESGVDSLGSEWDEKEQKFKHIGRNILNGKNLLKPLTTKEVPEDLLDEHEVDMVTGCCFGIEKQLFLDLKGFNEQYKIGYWEDADLCMKVKSEGYKILINPKSVITHSVGHSGSANHKHVEENKKLFLNTWIKTNKFKNFDKNIRSEVKEKVIGCVIVCNEEEFLEASVESVSDLVDEWIIVVGGNKYAYKSKMCDEKGYPTDNTLQISRNIVKKYGGIVIEPPGRLWEDKIEMRNAYASRLKQNEWMFMLDGDEVYKKEDLLKITKLMNQYECLILQFWLFWNDVNTIGTGVWDNYPQERIVKWKEGYAYRKSHLHVSDIEDNFVKDKVKCYSGNDRLFYHYSWVRPIEKIQQKLDYYKYQTGISRDYYLHDVFLKYRKTKKVNGTHPFGGGGAIDFDGVHPKYVRELIKNGKLNF